MFLSDQDFVYILNYSVMLTAWSLKDVFFNICSVELRQGYALELNAVLFILSNHYIIDMFLVTLRLEL